MKFINLQYASIKYVHTLNIPSNLYKLKETLDNKKASQEVFAIDHNCPGTNSIYKPRRERKIFSSWFPWPKIIIGSAGSASEANYSSEKF